MLSGSDREPMKSKTGRNLCAVKENINYILLVIQNFSHHMTVNSSPGAGTAPHLRCCSALGGEGTEPFFVYERKETV